MTVFIAVRAPVFHTLVRVYNRNLPFCWLCFLPMLGGPWKVHSSLQLDCRGERVHQDATYIPGCTAPRDPVHHGSCLVEAPPMPRTQWWVVVVVRLLGGGVWLGGVFLLDFMLVCR
jgi:hypothetical protein